MNKSRAIAAVAGYATSIVLANLFITWFGLWQFFGLAFPAGTVFAGAAFFLRDAVHRYAGLPAALGAIVAGAGLSYALASPALALASGTAFLFAELADAFVFAKVRRKRGTAQAVALSGVVGAVIDTFLFLPMADIQVTFDTATGQLVVKSALSALAGAIVWCVKKRQVA